MPIKILGAAYGTLTAGNDVTATCQNLVNNGNDDIPVNNTSMGGDPDVGVKKRFGIVYELPDGSIQARACIEGETIDLVN